MELVLPTACVDRGLQRVPLPTVRKAVLPKPGGVEPDGTSSGLKWVRNQDWKLYNNGHLFHMAKDPLEKRPYLASTDTAAMRETRQSLRAVLKRMKN